jgi:hypothetical protein
MDGRLRTDFLELYHVLFQGLSQPVDVFRYVFFFPLPSFILGTG